MHFEYRLIRQSLLSFIEIAFSINLIVLDVVILGHIPQAPLAAANNYHQPIQSLTSPLAIPTPSISLLTPTRAVSPSSMVTSISSQPSLLVKEYFIPFGNGASSAGDWENVTGLQSPLDSTQYAKIKKVDFEASVHIPTGNEWASVRLYNLTDQHPVWYSDVTVSGGAPSFLISAPITLDPGNNIYQVQMKTQLQYPAILDQARIHILLQ